MTFLLLYCCCSYTDSLFSLCEQASLGIYFQKKYVCFAMKFALNMYLLAHFSYNKFLFSHSHLCFKNMPGMQLTESQFHTKAGSCLNIVFLHYSKSNAYPEAAFIVWKFDSTIVQNRSYFRLLHIFAFTTSEEDKRMSVLLSFLLMLMQTLLKMQFFRMGSLLIFVLYKSLLKMKDMAVFLKIEKLLNLFVLIYSALT